MKPIKYILGVIAIALTLNVQANEIVDSVKSVSNSVVKSVKETATQIDTSSLSKQVYADVKSALTGLASGLKVGAEHVYKVLIKQQVVKSVIFIIIFIIGILLLFYFINVFKSSKWGDSYYCKPEDKWNKNATLSLIFGVLSFSFLSISIANIDIIVTGIINPEYGAIEKILEMIK